MYICICNAVTDKQIKIAIDQGADTRRQLRQCLGVGNNCGQCTRQVVELLDANRPDESIINAALIPAS